MVKIVVAIVLEIVDDDMSIVWSSVMLTCSRTVGVLTRMNRAQGLSGRGSSRSSGMSRARDLPVELLVLAEATPDWRHRLRVPFTRWRGRLFSWRARYPGIVDRVVPGIGKARKSNLTHSGTFKDGVGLGWGVGKQTCRGSLCSSSGKMSMPFYSFLTIFRRFFSVYIYL